MALVLVEGEEQIDMIRNMSNASTAAQPSNGTAAISASSHQPITDARCHATIAFIVALVVLLNILL